jgi:hypothetical protein
MRRHLRLIPACLLGVGAAVLVSCGSSGKGLIPLSYAGPLQGDFQAVLQAAQEGNGSCSATEAKIRKTEQDLNALPATIDSGLRGRLAEGVANLSARARVLCSEPLAQATTTTETTTVTTTTPTSTATQPTSTEPSTTPTTGTAPTPTTSQPPGEEGGTQAPGTSNGEGRGEEEGNEQGAGGAQAVPGESGTGAGTGGTGGGGR